MFEVGIVLQGILFLLATGVLGGIWARDRSGSPDAKLANACAGKKATTGSSFLRYRHG